MFRRRSEPLRLARFSPKYLQIDCQTKTALFALGITFSRILLAFVGLQSESERARTGKFCPFRKLGDWTRKSNYRGRFGAFWRRKTPTFVRLEGLFGLFIATSDTQKRSKCPNKQLVGYAGW
jgi:hypothetical protein